jgi:hypothetical protein
MNREWKLSDFEVVPPITWRQAVALLGTINGAQLLAAFLGREMLAPLPLALLLAAGIAFEQAVREREEIKWRLWHNRMMLVAMVVAPLVALWLASSPLVAGAVWCGGWFASYVGQLGYTEDEEDEEDEEDDEDC